jgi:hypothetical protein
MKTYDKWRKLPIQTQIAIWEESIFTEKIYGAAADSFGTFSANESFVELASSFIEEEYKKINYGKANV